MLSGESDIRSTAPNSENDASDPIEADMIVEKGVEKVQNSFDNDAEQDSASNSSDSMSSHSSSDDPLALIKNVIKWKDGVGYLPGSVCRFKLDEAGDLLLADDEADLEEEPFRKRQKLMTAKIGNDDEFIDSEMARCRNCKTLGHKSDFLKDSNFCKDCVHLNPLYYKMFKQLSQLYDESKNDTQKLSRPATPTAPSAPLVTFNHSDAKSFSWESYIEQNNFTPIPFKSFLSSQLCQLQENGFKLGMKMEGVDPFHPSRFCVLTVTEIIGFRLRLHFDGYKRKYDFWVNANNEFIFPAGFCKATHRQLEPPKGIAMDDFDWGRYLVETKSVAAPAILFTCPTDDREKFAAVVSTGFNVGMKLEAVDKANNNLVCVASIKDILNDHLLIHFDGWDDSYDYWAHYTSSLIHPINWCKSRGKPLTAPKDYSGDTFNWDAYLSETDMVSVPARAFKNKLVNNWKTGMKLEAMDLHNPRLIRVATIASRTGHVVRIHFDGLDDKLDYWIDDDCPNLHPVHWCAQTNHPLKPPPVNNSKNSKKTKITCTIANCDGQGHVHWYNHRRHDKVEDCPYSEDNLDIESNDRYESDNESVESDEDPDDEDEDDEEEKEDEDEAAEMAEEEEKKDEGQKEQNEVQMASDMSSNEDEDAFANYSFSLIEQEYSMPANVIRCKQLLNGGEIEFKPSEVSSWDYTAVERFVYILTGCSQASRAFADERIDGESLLMLKHDDLTNLLNLKLGPATKIYSCIAEIRAALLVDGQ